MRLPEIDNDFKSELQNKWLDYYEKNASWLIQQKLHSGYLWEKDKQSYSRPSSSLIIAVVLALEPRLSRLIAALCKFNNLDEVVASLGLDFDPEVMIAKRELNRLKPQEQKNTNVLPTSKNDADPDTEYLNKIRQENQQ